MPTPRRRIVRPRGAASWLVALLVAIVAFGGASPAAHAEPVTWSAAVQPPTSAPYAAAGAVNSIACPTASLCVAGTESGNVLTSPGVSGPWTKRASAGLQKINDVACSSATECVVVATGGVAMGSADPTNAASWKVLFRDGNRVLNAVSCVDGILCMIAGRNGNTGAQFVSNDPLDGEWFAASYFNDTTTYTDVNCVNDGGFACLSIDGQGSHRETRNQAPRVHTDWSSIGAWPLISVSCPTYAKCWGVLANGNSSATSNPRVFYSINRGFPEQPGAKLDCPTTNFCVEITPGGTARRSSNPVSAGSWETTYTATAMRTVACLRGTAQCAIALGDGRIVSTTDAAAATPTWTATANPVEQVNSITDIDCASSSACAAVDDRGHLLTATTPKGAGNAWTISTIHPGNRAAQMVDCPTTTLCVAGYTDGDLVTVSNPVGARTSAVRNVAGTDTITAVACPTAGLCVATTDTGKIITSTAPTTAAWTTRSIIAAPIAELACWTVTDCRAITADGRLLMSTDPAAGTWSAPVAITSLQNPTAMSCIRAELCVVGTADGRIGMARLGTTPPRFDAQTISGFPAARISAVECTREGLCIVTGANGYVIELMLGRFFRHIATKLTTGSPPTALACDANSVCVMGGTSGDLVPGTQNRSTLTIARTGTGTGRVFTLSPATIALDCGTVCTANVPRHQNLAVRGEPTADSDTTDWGEQVYPCDGDYTHCFSVDGDETLTVTFTKKQLWMSVTGADGPGRVTSTPAGIDCEAQPVCSHKFDIGSTVTLTATPNAGGATFEGWTGACSGTAPTCQVTMSQERIVGATFKLAQRTLTVAATGPGKVTSAPAGIDCGANCQTTHDDGEVVTLTATPTPGGATFEGWSGACAGQTITCQVTMSAARTVAAKFRPLQRTFVAIANGAGTVTSAPAGINCGTTCETTFDDGSTVTLTATPSEGATFTGWSGACSGTENPCKVTMGGTRAVTATFAAGQHSGPGQGGDGGAGGDGSGSGSGQQNTGGGTPPPAGPPAPATPQLSAFSLSAPSVEPGKSVAFTVQTSEAGTPRVVISKSTNGRTVKGVCKPETKKTKKAKKCTFDKVLATLTAPSATGKVTIAFNGKVGGKNLPAGTYKATITVTGPTGLVSKPTVITFKVKAAKKGGGKR